MAVGGAGEGGDGEGGGSGAGQSNAGGGSGIGGTGGVIAGDEGGAAGAAGNGTSASLSITNLAIDPNPNMTISCFVSWTTDEPASSEVDFGEGTYAFRIRDATLVTEHHVLVIGMHAETQYKIKAVSSTGALSGAAEGTFTTGSLPADFPLATLTVNDATKSQGGWTLTGVHVGSIPTVVVMYDESGLPVWYYLDGPASDNVYAGYLGNSILITAQQNGPAREVDLSGSVLWEGPPNTNPQRLETHDILKTSAANYLVNTDYWTQIAGNWWIDAFVQELDPDLNQAWSWHLFDHQPPAGKRGDICHGNAMILDETANVLYYNCRFLGLMKVDRVTGDILWRLGGTFDVTTYGPGDFTFGPPESQYSDTHDPDMNDDGTILFYDNGGYLNHSSGEYHSRIVEYQVDENTMTATRTFEFPGDFSVDAWYTENWYSLIMGGARRLANGNILVDAPTASNNDTTHIFEVTRTGEVVWQVTLPVGETTYRARRLSPPPLVEPLP